MSAPSTPAELQEALCGQWNTPRPVNFAPSGDKGTVQSSGGEMKMSADITKRRGKLQRLVTLRDTRDGFSMTGCADMRFRRVHWENGAVWSKVASTTAASPAARGRSGAVSEQAALITKDDDRKVGMGCCSLFGNFCGSKKAMLLSPKGSSYLGHELPVEVISARGLRKADWTSSPDVYCTCGLENKPGAISFRTQTMTSVNPVWNYTGLLRDYCVGDSLVFTLWDKDVLKSREPLGKVIMPSKLFHPNGFEGEVPIQDAGEGVRAFLAVDVAPASEASGRRPLLSERQVANVVERVNEHLDVPLVPESMEASALDTLVSTLNRRLRSALLTFCERGWVNAMELLLDEGLDRRTKTHEVSVVLRTAFRDPLAKALTGIINSVIETPGFVQDKLLQVNKYIVNQIVEELIESALDGLEDVGLNLSMEDEERKAT